MASTSASSFQKSFKYDVFLSFRGEDTRGIFVGHLYHALCNRGIKTYKDNERIKKGKRISDQLNEAIEESRFYIIIFSKDYASSSWCLKELVKIMECQKATEHTAYPVFYDVEPTHLRNQSGAFEIAFEKHVKEDGAGRWRDALKDAGGLAGWELKNTIDRDEAKLIQQIVQEISLELRLINPSFDEKLVGMETRVKKIVSSFKNGFDDIRMIGIKGIGGGGKTTLARAVFDHISFLFEGKSFVKNVRAVSKGSSSGLEKLQKQVLKDVLNDQRIDETSDSDREMKRMCSTKVLLVLDDVDGKDQLEALAGSPNWFKPGSRIIITTRDEQVLKAHKVHDDNIHDVNQLLLSDEEAVCLFSRYAFGKDIPIQGYEGLSRIVIQYAAGLPLTIKVLGSHLCGRTECEWIDAIERLKTIPEDETLKRLELSYNGLENDQKEIFLDVACILKGEMKDEAIRVLESREFHAKIGLRVLEQKSLVTISNDGRLGLHDRIEEMGKNIVRHLHPDEPQRHDRLWIKEEIEYILKEDLGTEAIRCIKLEGSDLCPAIIMNGLKKMSELRFLSVDTHFCEVDKIDEVGQYLPNTLRSLHWPGYPLGCLPNKFQANKLADLAMVQSKICQLWEEGERKVFSKLKFLDFKNSHLRTFDLGTAKHLEMLDLRKCTHFVNLQMPNESLKLKFLDLSGSKVCNFTQFNFEVTPQLEKLTLSIGKTSSLQDNNIGTLKYLKSLILKSCWHLKQLPTDICKLKRLEELHLTELSDLDVIPDSICTLKCLKSLHLPYVKAAELPKELGNLKCLKELNIEGAGITHLPDSILNVKGLCIVWSRGRLESYGFTSFTEISEYTVSCYI